MILAFRWCCLNFFISYCLLLRYLRNNLNLIIAMSQIDKLIYFPLLVWFAICLFCLYFLMYTLFFNSLIKNLKIRSYLYDISFIMALHASLNNYTWHNIINGFIKKTFYRKFFYKSDIISNIYIFIKKLTKIKNKS